MERKARAKTIAPRGSSLFGRMNWVPAMCEAENWELEVCFG